MSRKNIVTILLKMKFWKVYLIFEFQLCTVVVNDSVTRQAITKEQEELFLEFIRMMTITQNTIMECLFCLRLDFVFLSFVD